MKETIAESRQVEEQQRLREAAERREEEERPAQEAAERRVQPNTLFCLLDRCHNSLSQAYCIQVETDATLTTLATLATQADAADPGIIYAKHIVPWLDFPQILGKQADLFSASFRDIGRDTVGNFVEKVIEALRDDERLTTTRGHREDRRTRGLDEVEEGDEEPRRDRRGVASRDDAIVQSAAQSDDPRIGGEYLDVLRDISETFRQDPQASVSTRAQLRPSTRPLKAVAVIKNRIRHLLLPQPRRATDRAAASATTARQPWEAKGHEPTETIKRPPGKTDILRDHTAPMPVSVAWSTEDLWIKHAPAGNLTVVSDTPLDRRSSHASSVVNLPEIEISHSYSCTCVVGQGIL
ncbi:hypothetical protein AAWM_07233 [Aspergillus awamori]|uniref:Uncharacterized protein n=1 Tax=Aspergillus awamori TaxID=105351 RepID=A0A401KYG6_ASPAW|nr:hypothetical protein AAWM_07233 [Aspergillus awamori]